MIPDLLIPLLQFGQASLSPENVQVDWIEQLQQGGLVVLVQGLLVVGLIAICIERMLSLRLKHFAPRGFSARILQLFDKGDQAEMEITCQKETHTLARVVNIVLEHGTNGPGVVDKIRDSAQRDIESEYEKLASLSLIAAAAPLLGLLGTMIGMIESFQLVALYGDDGGASMLAGSIAKALITTATGLVIALPALFLHHHFKRNLQKISKTLETEIETLETRLAIGQPPAANASNEESR